MPASHVLPRTGLVRRRIAKLCTGLDTILACNRPLAADYRRALKPFGTAVQIGTDSTDESSFDLDALFQAHPERIAELFAHAVELIRRVISLEHTVKPLHELGEAFKLAQDPGCKIVLEAGAGVTVHAELNDELQLRPDATYIVAGGLGDLGKRYLRLMATAGAKHLVTLSRSVDAVVQQELERELQQMQQGLRLHCQKCNITSREEVRIAQAALRRLNFPQVRGVVQGAVVLNDSTLDTMSAAAFNGVLDTKMDGTLNINQVFAGESLDFFVSLSSVVGIVGTSGQANYNAGNTVQDALAQFSPRTACHYMLLNIGMVADSATIRGSDVRVNALRRQGMQPVASSTLDALFAFSMSLAARSLGCTQAALGFTPASLAGTTAVNGTSQTPMFAHVRALAPSAATNSNGSDAAEPLLQHRLARPSATCLPPATRPPTRRSRSSPRACAPSCAHWSGSATRQTSTPTPPCPTSALTRSSPSSSAIGSPASSTPLCSPRRSWATSASQRWRPRSCRARALPPYLPLRLRRMTATPMLSRLVHPPRLLPPLVPSRPRHRRRSGMPKRRLGIRRESFAVNGQELHVHSIS
jgi:NAD(P)-dependent dehydrogenase (short-subunit alcohol dehydrogenase family)